MAQPRGQTVLTNDRAKAAEKNKLLKALRDRKVQLQGVIKALDKRISTLSGKSGLGTRRRDLVDQEDVWLDQAFFTVDAGTFAKFSALLDRPLPPTNKLRGLLKTKAPWEK